MFNNYLSIFSIINQNSQTIFCNHKWSKVKEKINFGDEIKKTVHNTKSNTYKYTIHYQTCLLCNKSKIIKENKKFIKGNILY